MKYFALCSMFKCAADGLFWRITFQRMKIPFTYPPKYVHS